MVADADNPDNYRLVGFFDVVPEELPTYRWKSFFSCVVFNDLFSEFPTQQQEIVGVVVS